MESVFWLFFYIGNVLNLMSFVLSQKQQRKIIINKTEEKINQWMLRCVQIIFPIIPADSRQGQKKVLNSNPIRLQTPPSKTIANIITFFKSKFVTMTSLLSYTKMEKNIINVNNWMYLLRGCWLWAGVGWTAPGRSCRCRHRPPPSSGSPLSAYETLSDSAQPETSAVLQWVRLWRMIINYPPHCRWCRFGFFIEMYYKCIKMLCVILFYCEIKIKYDNIDKNTLTPSLPTVPVSPVRGHLRNLYHATLWHFPLNLTWQLSRWPSSCCRLGNVCSQIWHMYWNFFLERPDEKKKKHFFTLKPYLL